MTGSLFGRPLLLLAALSFAGALAGPARAQCDEDADWDLFAPTGDVAEIILQGSIAWVAADGGIIRIDVSQISGGAPDQIKISDREGLISTDVTCMAEDALGNVWVGTKTSGVSIFDSAGRHLTDLTSFDELWGDNVTAIGRVDDRMFVVSVDDFTPQGAPEGGGIRVLLVESDGSGGVVITGQGLGTRLELGQAVLAVGSTIWFGTNGGGLWRRDETQSPLVEQFLTQAEGLASNNVKKLATGPYPGLPSDVLWIGTGAGLQIWDGAALTDVDVVDDGVRPGTENILDLYRQANTMYALVEVGEARDLYTVDLTSTPVFGIRQSKSSCLPDSTHVPREVAVDADGRIVLGTRRVSFTVREGPTWYCPPPVGPHAPQVADVVLSPDGSLYFGTGSRPTDTRPGNGMGIFRGGEWGSLTREDGIGEPEVVWVEVWPDSSVWLGTAVDAFTGGVTRWFPNSGGALLPYHNAVGDLSRRTLGRNVGGFRLDASNNLWISYGQQEGGVSIVEWPSELITNFPIAEILPGGNDLLTGLAFDSRGRAWVITRNTANKPGNLHVIDVRGTPASKGDDVYKTFLLASEVVPLGDVWDIDIDENDTIWLAGQDGIAIGEIGPDFAGEPSATWFELDPSASQLGGRNPLPYTASDIDWEGNIWLGTESAGLVRVSADRSNWTWYDQNAGCPLPDQSVSGLYVDRVGRRVWVGMLTGGLARIDFSGSGGGGSGDRIDPEAYPNPYRPDVDGPLRFRTLPIDEAVTFRIYTLTGELVHETRNSSGERSWDGRNRGDQIVEPGVYVITARGADGQIYEGKVAILR